MIVELLSQLPETIEVYGFRFKLRIYFEDYWDTWIVAYVPDAVIKKTAAKKKVFAAGRWIDKDAKISTNGSKWLIAKPIENSIDNQSFENALTQLYYDLLFMQRCNFKNDMQSLPY